MASCCVSLNFSIWKCSYICFYSEEENISNIGWTGGRIDQSQGSLLDLSRLLCDWSRNTMGRPDQWSSSGGGKKHGLTKRLENGAYMHVAIFLEKQKNDQFREGSWVFIAHCSTSPCLVKIIEKFLRIANHSKGSPLFWSVFHTKRGVRLQKEGMCYRDAKELIKREIGMKGLDCTTRVSMGK